MRKLLLPFVIAVVCLALPTPAHAAWVSVTPDGESYLVTAGALFTDNYGGDRKEAATCSTCFWWVHRICASWDDANHGWCPWMLLQCPRDQQLAEVFRADANAFPPLDSPLWHRTGYTCIGDPDLLSARQVTTEVSDSWRMLIPPMGYRISPPGQTLVNLETIVEFSSPSYVTDARLLAGGIEARLYVTANRSVNCRTAGCRKLTATSVLFDRGGTGVLRIRSTWTASYDALGISGLPVSGSVTQQRDEQLRVWELWSRLRTL